MKPATIAIRRAAFLLAGFAGLSPLMLAAAPATASSNTDETKVAPYTLPDVLLTNDGRHVTDAATWRTVRRGELFEAFCSHMYGRTPVLPVKLRAEVTATRTDAVDKLATRTLVTLRLFDDPAAPPIHLMLYVPNAARHPVPVFLGLNYFGPASIETDPSLPLTDQWMRPVADMGIVKNRATEATRGRNASSWPLALALRRGYAVATYFYGDLESDHDGPGTAEWPAPDTPIGHQIGYHLRTGKHDITAYDWERFLDFADRRLPAARH